MKLFLFVTVLGTAAWVAAQEGPPAEVFRVLPSVTTQGPTISGYLKYQTEMAWNEDDARRRAWKDIRTQEDLFRTQEQLRTKLLAMIGGLPGQKTALNARITGRIQMDGFHIEKLVFESMPRLYVTALLYVPDDQSRKHPAVLVPVGHATNGKAHYQALCQHLVQRGYVVISWDPPGQAERSQFWDAKNHKSRYNLICAEHAVMGNLAYLAGTSLARWEIWDGIRAVDYLLTRPDVDPERINITGTSGGGFQATLIAALDRRIKVAAPSCYITALPMRVFNRIFKDPDSDPEQDLYEMISSGMDHPGLLLLMYPRPVFVAAAVLDFFPIEGTHKTFREVSDLYTRFGYGERIGMREGYHDHQFSPENQEAALEFLDHFNGMPRRRDLGPEKELDDATLQCTRTGQVMVDYPDADSILDSIRRFYLAHKAVHDQTTLKQLYYSGLHPDIANWTIRRFEGGGLSPGEIRWEQVGSSEWRNVMIERYLLRHSDGLEIPLLWIHKRNPSSSRILFWLGEDGKVALKDWPQVIPYVNSGYDVISIDPRGLGETRMPYKALSPDDPSLGNLDFDHAYMNPLSSVLADYVYNSILTGRPYFLQMIEDLEIAKRFAQSKSALNVEWSVTGDGDAATLASAVAETLPAVRFVQGNSKTLKWSELVEQKSELWPVQVLLPDGAYIH
jgi:hypothetical protein